MRTARSQLGKFGRTIERVGKKLALFGSVAAAAGTAALTIITKRAFASGDALAKLSNRLGISVQDLQVFQLAAQLGGVKVETLNMALQRFVRRLGEAANDTGEAVAALKELQKFGLLSARELVKGGLGEAFLKFVEAISKANGPAQRLVLNFKLLDSEGAALVQTMLAGRKPFDDLRKELESMGLLLSRQQLAKIEMANDLWTKLRFNVAAVAQLFAAQLAPFVGAVADRLQMFGNVGGGAAKIIEKGFALAVKVVAFMADRVDDIRFGFKFATVAALEFAAKVTRAFGELLVVIERTLKFLDRIPRSFKLAGIGLPRGSLVASVGKGDVRERPLFPIRNLKHDLNELMNRGSGAPGRLVPAGGFLSRMAKSANAAADRLDKMAAAAKAALAEQVRGKPLSELATELINSIQDAAEKQARKIAQGVLKANQFIPGIDDIIDGAVRVRALTGFGPQLVTTVGAQRPGLTGATTVHDRILVENQKQVKTLAEIRRAIKAQGGLFN